MKLFACLVALLLPWSAWAVSEIEINRADAGSWLSHGRTYDEKRYSPLDQINEVSVTRLGMVWKYETGNRRGMEATPLIADGVMYISTAWSRVAALDAKTGQQIWRYDPGVAGEKGRDACCDVVNRGVALWGDKVFLGALDGRLIALDRKSGREVWSVQTTDVNKPYTITGAPRVVKGKVIIGNGGAEFGVRGYFSAYDAETGKLLWRFYTVPGEHQSPDEPLHLKRARETWSPDSRWETGLGGTVWDSFAYDEQLNLLYVGVGNSSQYNRAIRSPGGGDNLYLSSILAVNPDNGELAWHYQTTPAEAWDYTATQHMILADLNILGETRKVIMQAPKNGFFYVLDRITGEFISAKNYVLVNWASHIDENGRPVETGIGDWSEAQQYISPAIFGGHNWHPMSFSEKTKLVYIPTIHMVYPFNVDTNFEYNPGTFNTGEDMAGMMAQMPPVQPRMCSPTRLTAWDPVNQREVWQVPFTRGVSAGVLSTAGGLVFQGTADGWLKAYRDTDGKEMWAGRTNVGIMAPPVSYEIDNEQYIAVVAGLGGALGGHADKLNNVNTGHVFAFKLGADLDAPEIPPRVESLQVNESLFPQGEVTPELVSKGQALYAVHCARCHGGQAKSSGLYPDLRQSSEAVHKLWRQIVVDGVFAPKGMAGFSDVLTEQDADAIHSYVIDRAIKDSTWYMRAAQGLADQVCIPAEWLAD